MNAVPRPPGERRLDARRQPCRSQRRRAMARPRPRTRAARRRSPLVDSMAAVVRSNTCGSEAVAMPGPSSRKTSERASPPMVSAAGAAARWRCGRCCGTTTSRACASTRDRSPASTVDDPSPSPTRRRDRRTPAQALDHELAQLDRLSAGVAAGAVRQRRSRSLAMISSTDGHDPFQAQPQRGAQRGLEADQLGIGANGVSGVRIS